MAIPTANGSTNQRHGPMVTFESVVACGPDRTLPPGAPVPWPPVPKS